MDTKKHIPIIQIEQENILTGNGHSSRGNQLKWEQDGWWYKADALGYEGLAEVVASELLKHSNRGNFVEYEPAVVRYKDRYYRGCRSRNFKREGEELVTLEKLYRIVTGLSLAEELAHIAETGQRIAHTVNFVENVTGLRGFGRYLSELLETDAFFLNEDRHTNNIALLYDSRQNRYRLCPCFDMGLSLFADTTESFPLERSVEECYKLIKAKPFDRDFLEQMDAAAKLYGGMLQFDMSRHDIRDFVGRLKAEFLPSEGVEWYTGEWNRVEETLVEQALTFSYAFR